MSDQPTTEAGRALFARLQNHDAYRDPILAIEREAAEAARAEVADPGDGLREAARAVVDENIDTLETALGSPAATAGREPQYCGVHQSYGWCEHNGGVMGETGWEAPQHATGREPLDALREVATRLVNAYDAYVDALNGRGHDGEPHDRVLHQSFPGEVEIFDAVGDCASCGAAQYGTEDAVQQGVVDVKVALGLPLRGYEEPRAALAAATPSPEPEP